MNGLQRMIFRSCLCGILIMCIFLNLNIDSLNNNIHTNGAFNRMQLLQSSESSNISITTNHMCNHNLLFRKQICPGKGLGSAGQTKVNKLLDFHKTVRTISFISKTTRKTVSFFKMV